MSSPRLSRHAAPAAAPAAVPSSLLETAEAQANEEERQYRTFMQEEALKARREEEQSEAEARRENDAKTAEAAYASALSVIDKTIDRAQTYGERMLGMHGSNLSDESMGVKEQPRNLVGTLRDYQLEGFRWIVRRAFAGESIILADEMGLGALLAGQVRARPALPPAGGPAPSLTPPSCPPPPPPLRTPAQARRCRSFPTCAGRCCKRLLALP